LTDRARFALRGTLACLALATAVVALSPSLGTASSVVPTQWIAKQYSELLGRAPRHAEWTSWVHEFEGRLHCRAPDLGTMGRRIADSDEFTSAYPDDGVLERAQRFTALLRATFSRDPVAADWTTWFAPYRDDRDAWAATVDAMYESAEFSDRTVPSACSSTEPGYGFVTGDVSPAALDLRALSGLGTSRTQDELQREIDVVAARGGGPVLLEPGELVRVGVTGTDHRPLLVRSGVTLTTAGAPGPARYARMGRIVPERTDAQPCQDECSDAALVRVAPGGSVTNVWVDGNGLDEALFKVAAVETWGSDGAAPTRIVGNRISVPARDGVGIRARGFSVTGEPCRGQIVSGNVLTGYASQQRFDSQGQARWSDGIAVECEAATVERNELVDISDAAIVLYGAYNRALDATRAQTSTVSRNQILSAGLSGHVALGFDAIGECAAHPDGPLVPCLDSSQSRDFRGASITGNTYWTGPSTHFDIGIMVGGAPRWGSHRVPSSGGTASDNTAAAGTRVNMGITVLGMTDSVLRDNTHAFELVDGNELARWGKCPEVAVGVGSSESASTTVEPPTPTEVVDAADGCLLGEPSPDGLDAIAVGTDGETLVFASTAERFIPWGMRTPHEIPETFWHSDWNRLVEAFREVRRMGANLVRFNVQFGSLVGPPNLGHPSGTVNTENLQRLQDVVALAEETGLYIAISGLRVEQGYDSGDWYGEGTDAERWESQALWWKAVAGQLRDDASVAWYDVMNEPIVPGSAKTTWCAGAIDDRCFAVYLVKDPGSDARVDIVRRWLTAMRSAIRSTGDDHLLTVSTLPYGNSGFRPVDVADLQDLASVHLYPSAGRAGLERALADVPIAKAARQPLVLDETGPYGGGDLEAFIRGTAPDTAGWVGHYLEATPAEILADADATIGDTWRLGWYRTFLRLAATVNPRDGGVVQP
jgi:hypothetical protein